MSDCLFCRILAGDVPAEVVYQDEHSLAFLDIRPVQPGHTLIIPKVHVSSLLELPTEAMGPWMRSIQRVAEAVLAATKSAGFNLKQNNGPVAGQVIPHLHMHVIPRFSDDGLLHWQGQPYPSDQAASDMAAKIRQIIR